MARFKKIVQFKGRISAGEPGSHSGTKRVRWRKRVRMNGRKISVVVRG